MEKCWLDNPNPTLYPRSDSSTSSSLIFLKQAIAKRSRSPQSSEGDRL
ncbi:MULTISPECIES: hypothetical protein [Spirulina sp. CCY15215]|nr:hypothetical protein [Spirulina major]